LRGGGVEGGKAGVGRTHKRVAVSRAKKGSQYPAHRTCTGGATRALTLESVRALAPRHRYGSHGFSHSARSRCARGGRGSHQVPTRHSHHGSHGFSHSARSRCASGVVKIFGGNLRATDSHVATALYTATHTSLQLFTRQLSRRFSSYGFCTVSPRPPPTLPPPPIHAPPTPDSASDE
jgi:hypothetical protein